MGFHFRQRVVFVSNCTYIHLERECVKECGKGDDGTLNALGAVRSHA